MTSALDMPEIMSYIYSKSWKHQFSASSSIIIIEDYYLQTFLHSLQNYGAPKISQELRKSGETISQRTVGKYMREMGIRAQWTKPWTTTTRDSDFSKELHNVQNEQFNPNRRI